MAASNSCSGKHAWAFLRMRDTSSSGALGATRRSCMPCLQLRSCTETRASERPLRRYPSKDSDLPPHAQCEAPDSTDQIEAASAVESLTRFDTSAAGARRPSHRADVPPCVFSGGSVRVGRRQTSKTQPACRRRSAVCKIATRRLQSGLGEERIRRDCPQRSRQPPQTHESRMFRRHREAILARGANTG